jgi:hypothetical protein
MKLIASIALRVFLPFFALPFLGAMLAALSNRRIARIASLRSCPQCGDMLGGGARYAANQRKQEAYGKLQREHHGVRLRLTWPFDFMCIACGAHLAYCKETDSMELVETSEVTVDRANVIP